jgi:hypothetical protein
MARRPKQADITPPIFNPLSYRSLGAATAEALIERDIVPMAELPSFKGEGIYAIYYKGDYEPYAVISEANDHEQWQMPIYVGKADPSGGRHGLREDDDADTENQASAGVSNGYPLRKRLWEHIASINAAENLDINHFWCRFMLVNQVWVGLGEAMMISRYTPIWNAPINGFGNHNPGSGRPGKEGKKTGRSRWDTLHPGRTWAEPLAARGETAEMIANEARQILATKRGAAEPELFREIADEIGQAIADQQKVP